MSQEVKPSWPKRDIYLGVLTIVVTVALCVLAIRYQDYLLESVARMAGYSLLGVFLIAFIAGSAFSFAAIPIPYWLLVFTLSSVLGKQWGIWAPIWVGMTSALGTSLGHLPTFMIGYGGRKTYLGLTMFTGTRNDSTRPGLYTRIMSWARRHGAWAVFVMSAVFNPLHLPMTVAMGALHYPPSKFFLFSFLGNAVKGLFLGFCGYFGLTSLLHFVGIWRGG
jgi:membrane protein DedA with SNARE-associated domain